MERSLIIDRLLIEFPDCTGQLFLRRGWGGGGGKN